MDQEDYVILKILISAATGLGDFVFKTPLIYALKKEFPNIEIDFLNRNSWGIREVLAGENEINIRNIELPKEGTFISLCKFFKSLDKNYDYCILPYDACDRNLKWAAILFLRAKVILIHSIQKYKTLKSKMDFIVTNYIAGGKIGLVPIIKGRHEIDANLDFLAHIIAMPRKHSRVTKINPLKDQSCNYNLGGNYIVIQPSAANGMSNAKVWAPDNFYNLAMSIMENFPQLKIVLVGDAGDIIRLSGSRLLNNTRIINLMGKTNFSQLCEILRKAKIVIAHDSGVTHISNALDVRLIAMYGPTDHSKTMIFGKKSMAIISENETTALMYRTEMTEIDISHKYPPYYCMSGIKVETVFNEVVRILGDDQS